MEVKAKINRQRKMLIIEVPLQKAAPSKHSGNPCCGDDPRMQDHRSAALGTPNRGHREMPSCTRRRQRRRRSTEKTPSKALCAV